MIGAVTITSYLAHDRIHPVDPGADPYDTVLDDYQRLTADGSRVLLLARSRDDVDQLNTRARAHAIDQGEVQGDPLLSAGDREWRAGDRLRVTRDDRRIPVGTDHLLNGDLFAVTGCADAGLTVQRLDGTETAVLYLAYLADHAAYGWASTIDAAQGATVDHSLLLARPGLDRTRLRVAMTHGRQSNQLYVAPEPDPEITPRTWQRRPLDPGDELARMLTTPANRQVAIRDCPTRRSCRRGSHPSSTGPSRSRHVGERQNSTGISSFTSATIPTAASVDNAQNPCYSTVRVWF